MAKQRATFRSELFPLLPAWTSPSLEEFQTQHSRATQRCWDLDWHGAASGSPPLSRRGSCPRLGSVPWGWASPTRGPKSPAQAWVLLLAESAGLALSADLLPRAGLASDFFFPPALPISRQPHFFPALLPARWSRPLRSQLRQRLGIPQLCPYQARERHRTPKSRSGTKGRPDCCRRRDSVYPLLCPP